MKQRPRWAPPVPLPQLTARSLAAKGVVFQHNGSQFQTTGETIASGGMGDVFLLNQLTPDGTLAKAVGKVFHSEYLYQLRSDEVTRTDHELVQRNLKKISQIEHPGLLPTLIAEPIADNYLTVTPLRQSTLLEAVHKNDLTDRRRVKLLLDALRGLGKLHEHGFIHRDVTLRNILVDKACEHAFLFDFDLTLALSETIGETYKDRYKGRIFGSPGYSVPPEILDSALMESSITTKIDIYAVGGAIFGLFTDALPYGDNEDMWALLLRISEGVVFNGRSEIPFPPEVPKPLRPIINNCLERDPGNRYGTISLIVADLEAALPQLERGRRKKFVTDPVVTVQFTNSNARINAIHAARRDTSITKGLLKIVDEGLGRSGYQVQAGLGRVKGLPIFLAMPDPELVAAGRFRETNPYPKIVTVINLNQVKDRDKLVDLWLGSYVPILREARTKLVTSLHRVVHDEWSGFLFLFSEYVDDARFGTDLDEQDLSLTEALGLGFLLSHQIYRMHVQGMAHNNICARSLLLKGVKHHHQAWPAMIGIVAPSLDARDRITDVRRLAALTYGWLHSASQGSGEPTLASRLDDVSHRISNMAFSELNKSVTIEELIGCLSDGLATIDYNFGVLRVNEGDLLAYTLLMIGHPLFDRLWKNS